jgi:hypothetical protein
MDGFTELVITLTLEWIEKNGVISAEFATGGNNLEEKLKILAEYSPKNGMWIIHYCKTCEGYHADKPFHCEIISNNF